MPTPRRFDCKITDAKEPLEIRIKPCDIKGAVCKDHQRCVVAKAIMRQRKSTAKWVDVGAAVVLIGTGQKTAKRYVLSNMAKQQIRFFDTNDGRFAPCAVELKVPGSLGIVHGTQALGARAGEKPGGRKKKRKSPRKPTR